MFRILDASDYELIIEKNDKKTIVLHDEKEVELIKTEDDLFCYRTPSFPPDNLIGYTVGSTLCYPSDRQFLYLCRISEDLGRYMLHEKGLRFGPHQESTECFPKEFFEKDGELDEKHYKDNKYNNNQWLNKLAIIVAIEMTRVVAVYKHDFSHWLIYKNFNH